MSSENEKCAICDRIYETPGARLENDRGVRLPLHASIASHFESDFRHAPAPVGVRSTTLWAEVLAARDRGMCY